MSDLELVLGAVPALAVLHLSPLLLLVQLNQEPMESTMNITSDPSGTPQLTNA